MNGKASHSGHVIRSVCVHQALDLSRIRVVSLYRSQTRLPFNPHSNVTIDGESVHIPGQSLAKAACYRTEQANV